MQCGVIVFYIDYAPVTIVKGQRIDVVLFCLFSGSLFNESVKLLKAEGTSLLFMRLARNG